MFYVTEKDYLKWFETCVKRKPLELKIEPNGYSVLRELKTMGVVYHHPIPPEELLKIQFVVVFRSARSNLVAVKNDSFAIPVEIEKYPTEATFDDLLLLHGKKFIDDYIQTSNIEEFIVNTCIQPWGVVKIEDTLYVPIEIVVKDDIMYTGLCALNGDFTNDERELSDRNLVNGFTPIVNVRKYLLTKVDACNICNCIKDKLKVVNSNE